MAATTAQIQQALFTGCGVCGGAFCEHGICRVCSECQVCDMPIPRNEHPASESTEAARLHAKAEQRRRDVDQAMAELASSKCPCCHRRKREQQSFCKSCYTNLPKEIRAGLYSAISCGYLEFWQKAKALLEDRAKGGR